jgi:hypothetical protein
MPAPDGRLASCASCDTKNRVPAYSFKRRPRCGNCGAPLAESFRTRTIRRLYQDRYPIIAVAGLALFLVWQPTIASIDLSNSVTSTTPAPLPKDNCATRPQPHQGIYARYTQYPDVAPLTLRTARGSNYFVKINEAASGRPVLSLYVHGGSSFEIQVPRGSFVVKYATGGRWCSESELFGETTQTNKADRVFEFDDDHEYTIELIAQRNGNLPTRRISQEAFNTDG